MVNEVLCKIICHNICVLIQVMHERGIATQFWSSPRSAAFRAFIAAKIKLFFPAVCLLADVSNNQRLDLSRKDAVFRKKARPTPITKASLKALKWLNLHALATRLIRHKERVERVVWCTAVNAKNHQRMLRWRAYKKAVESVGIISMEGHFAEEPRKCHQGHNYFHSTEKEGDVNLAISLISDGHLDRYDVAYLVTADSDQIATVKMFRERLTTKQIISVAPPGRSHSKAIIAHSHDTRSIKREVIENCLFEGPTIIRNGTLIAARPAQYAPPDGWQPSPI